MTEKPAYTVAEVAALMGLSRHTVERVFRNERGVLLMGRSKTEPDKGPTRGKRSIRPSAYHALCMSAS